MNWSLILSNAMYSAIGVNAIGFALCGLVGWTMVALRERED